MWQLVAPMPGRRKPRWSRCSTGGTAQTVSSPALMAGLPASSAMVCVRPPLVASPAGSSSGFVLQNEVPVAAQPAPVKPHVVPSSMSWPPSVMVPAPTKQLPPVLLARMLLVTVRVGATVSVARVRETAPPLPALLPEKVSLVTVRVPPLSMAPPTVLALLLEKVLLVTPSTPVLFSTAPPLLLALLPETVLLATVAVAQVRWLARPL